MNEKKLSKNNDVREDMLNQQLYGSDLIAEALREQQLVQTLEGVETERIELETELLQQRRVDCVCHEAQRGVGVSEVAVQLVHGPRLDALVADHAISDRTQPRARRHQIQPRREWTAFPTTGLFR